MAFIRHDDAGAERILHQCLVVRVAELALVAKEKFKGIESIFAADADLLRCFHRHDRWNHAAYERAPFLVQRFQGCDLLWIDVRR